MGGCGSKKNPPDNNSIHTSFVRPTKVKFSSSWIEELDSEQLSDEALLPVPHPLLQEVHDVFEFNRVVDNCAVYRKASDSPFASTYVSLESRTKSEGLHKWRVAVKNSPILPGCSERLLSVVYGLPERSWNTEWRNARDEALAAEVKFTSSKTRSGEHSRNLLIELYATLAEIQEHFDWLVGIIFDALISPTTRNKLAALISRYYRNKAGASPVEPVSPVLVYSRRSSTDKSETNDQCIDGGTNAILEVLKHSAQLEREEFAETGTNILLEWASAGLEFLGVHFIVVRNPRYWKLFKRENTFCRRLLFEPEFPCPPLLSLVDSFGIGLCGSAIVPSSFPTPIVPVHLNPAFTSLPLHAINTSLNSKSIPSLQSFVTPLPNPGMLLSAFAPHLIPLNSSIEFPVEQLITAAVMCVGLPQSLPTLTSTSESMHKFGRSVSLAEQALQRSLSKEVQSCALECNGREFIENFRYGSGGRVPNSTEIAVPGVKYIALAFNETNFNPSIHKLDPNFGAYDISTLAAKEFNCDPLNVLPYAPLVELGYFNETRDPLWKTEIFGYKCAVWTLSVSVSPKGSFHTLSFRNPRRKTPRIRLRGLPWDSSQFVIVAAPSVLHLRLDLYLPSSQSSPTSETSVRRALRTLCTKVGGIRSSKPFHHMLHRFGLSVSVSSWEMWDILMNENPETLDGAQHAVLELISCDIVSAAVKRVVRFYCCDETGSLHFGLESDVLEVLLPSIFPLKENNENDNVKSTRSLLHVALWLSLLKAHQHSDVQLQPSTITKLLFIVARSPITFFNCLMDRCSITLDPASISLQSGPHRDSGFVSLKHCSTELYSASGSLSDFDPQSPSASSTRTSDVSKHQKMYISNIRIKSAFTSHDFVFRSMMVECIHYRDISMLRWLCHSIEFVDCCLPSKVNSIFFSFPVCASLSSFKSSVQLTASSFLLSLTSGGPSSVSGTSHPSSSRIEAILRICLCSCFDAAIASFSNRSADWVGNAENVISVCRPYFTMMKGQAPIDVVSGALCVQGFLFFARERDLQKGTILLHNALLILLRVFGHGCTRGSQGSSSCLYLCWILSHIHRLLHRSSLARMYERIFRSIRISTPCCSLSIAPPAIPDNFISDRFSTSKLSSDQVLAIMRYNHQLLADRVLNWILATNPLNSGHDMNDFSTVTSTTAFTTNDIPDSPHPPELETFNLQLSGPDSTLLSAVELDSGQLLALGSNASGCLGLGPPATSSSTAGVDVLWTCEPTAVTSLKDHFVTSMASGGSHCLALVDRHEVMAWGDNSHGQVGILNRNSNHHRCEEECPIADMVWTIHGTPQSDKPSPTQPTSSVPMVSSNCSFATKLQFNVPIANVYCGLNFSAALTDLGQLYTWGSNSFGQLGLGDYRDRFTPTLVDLPNVEKASCGYEYMGVISGIGGLFMWGRGSEGQLGLPIEYFVKAGDVKDSRGEYRPRNPTPSHLTPAEPESLGCFCKPQKICIYQFSDDIDPFSDDKIVSIGLQKRNSVVWRRDLSTQEWFVCIGRTPKEDSSVRYSEEVEFYELSCGENHTLAIDISNYVWSWGIGEMGQLGIGDLKNLSEEIGYCWSAIEPTAKGMVKCSSMKTGSERLEEEVRCTPCRLGRSEFNEERIVKVYSGKSMSVAIDQTGCLWTWGSHQRLAIEKNLSNALVPTRSSLLKDIIAFSFGWSGNRFGAVDANGVLTLWGVEFCGSLGSTELVVDCWKSLPPVDSESVVLPKPGNMTVWLESRIVDMVSLGLHHTLIRTASIEDLNHSKEN